MLTSTVGLSLNTTWALIGNFPWNARTSIFSCVFQINLSIIDILILLLLQDRQEMVKQLLGL